MGLSSVCLLWKTIWFLHPSFNWIVCYFIFVVNVVIGLYGFFIHFYINSLSDKWLANIFSHSVDCLFISLMIFFAVKKLFEFDIVPLIHFCFYCLCFWFQNQTVIAKINIKELFPYLYYQEFHNSRFSFKSLIHFIFFARWYSNHYMLFNFPNTIY